jgi:hypothetical protein
MPVLTWMLSLLLAQAGAEPDAAAGCANLCAQKQFAEALEPCREAHQYDPSSLDLTVLLAKAEYEDGDSAQSAKLWKEVLERRGWNFADAQARALALWRSGDMKGAEAIFRETLTREPSKRAYLDLGDFLLSFNRWGELKALCAEGRKRHPDECALAELEAVATASLDQDEAAAGLLRKAVAAGCPPFRWTELNPFIERLSRAPYRALLDPKKLVENLEGLDDTGCRLRLKLLEEVPTPEVAGAVAGVLMRRKDFEIIQRSLAILEATAPASMPAWKKVFTDGDFVLRKYALRTLRHLQDPAFIPLLEEEAKRETAPGNQRLAALTLGEFLLPTDRARAEALFASIPESDSLSCSAKLALAQDAEKRGEFARSLEFLERMKQGAVCRVDPKLLDRVRGEAASKTEAHPSKP